MSSPGPRWEVDFVKNDGCWDPDCGPEQPQVPGGVGKVVSWGGANHIDLRTLPRPTMILTWKLLQGHEAKHQNSTGLVLQGLDSAKVQAFCCLSFPFFQSCISSTSFRGSGVCDIEGRLKAVKRYRKMKVGGETMREEYMWPEKEAFIEIE